MGTTAQILWGALIGGLAGSLVTLVSQGFFKWWRRPILEIQFAENEPGCRISTNLPGSTEPGQSYLRLKIKNAGGTTANEVSLCVVKLKFEAASKVASSFEEEVLDLKLAMTNDQAAFRLAKGAHRYIDLFHVQKSPAGIGYTPDFVKSPASLARRRWGVGTYQFEVFASAENAESVHHVVSFHWDGTIPGLRIVGITGRVQTYYDRVRALHLNGFSNRILAKIREVTEWSANRRSAGSRRS